MFPSPVLECLEFVPAQFTLGILVATLDEVPMRFAPGATCGRRSRPISKKPVYTFEALEGGILGSAILAGVGVGIYTDARAGTEQCLRMDKVFQYELFKEVHDQMQKPFDKLAHMP